MRNLLSRVPRSAQAVVATLVRSTFAQPDAASTWAQHGRIVEQLRERFPRAADLLEEATPDLLAFTAFPKEHWRQIWSNNPQERLNKELRRRTDVVGIFPNRCHPAGRGGARRAERRVGGGPPLHERRVPHQDLRQHRHGGTARDHRSSVNESNDARMASVSLTPLDKTWPCDLTRG